MATYNGEKYIAEQIDSILNQSFKEWVVYIRDDGSKDNTVSIIKEYIEKYPDKIFLIEDNKKGLGAKLNFAELLKYSKNQYTMFCDQDDFWLEDKIETTLNEMKNMEDKYGKIAPILVHTDLQVVDGDLNMLDQSLWDYIYIDARRNSINYLMVQNTVTGCTVMINKALKNITNNIPQKAIMHDHWLAIVASVFGQIGIVDKPTMLYRQHGSNEVGAKKISWLERIKRKFKNSKEPFNRLNNEITQMEAFYEMFESELYDENKELILDFINLKHYNAIKRKYKMMKNKYYVKAMLDRIKNLVFI